jgi:glycosyltransferase involved in cell wall biosynthesis
MRWFLKSPIFSDLLGAIVLGERLKKDIDPFISNDRLFVLPNCIPDIDPKLLRTRCKKKFDDKIRILYLSNLNPEKGPIEFIKMARRVVDRVESVRFVLAGPVLSSSFERQIKRLISDLKLIDYVDIVGAVYGPAKEKLFLNCDIFVFPSHNEAFPLVNLEAMRAGMPIVSSNVGSIPEMVVDELNGYIVNSKNVEQLSERVLKLVDDEELRNKMGKAGRKTYEEFFTIQAYEKRLNDGVKFFFKLSGLDTSYKCF